MRKLLLSLLSVIPLTSCLFGNSENGFVLDASKVPEVSDFENQTLKVSGHAFIYRNVYRNEQNEFVFCDAGFLESTNCIPDSMMSLDKNDGFIVYGINGEEEEIINPTSTEENGEIIYDYVLFGYIDFRITNTLNDDNTLGVITFWS